MKRGLVVLDEAETPAAEWEARLDALRAALREAGVDAGLVYGDVSRSDDIAYLTNLCIYWNEGVLVVPVDGEPAFATKLSKRVHPWMRASSTIRELRSGPRLAANVASLVGEASAVGVVDADWWPAQLLADVEAALGGARVVALAGAVRLLRVQPSASELALLRRASAVLGDAVRAAGGGSAAERIGNVERGARRAGFLDVFVSADERSLDATGQFRHLWVRAARSGDDARLARALRAARAGARRSDLAEAAGVAVRCIHHTDLATGGDLEALAGADHNEPLADGAVVAILAGRSCDTVLIRANHADSLTGGPR